MFFKDGLLLASPHAIVSRLGRTFQNWLPAAKRCDKESQSSFLAVLNLDLDLALAVQGGSFFNQTFTDIPVPT